MEGTNVAISVIAATSVPNIFANMLPTPGDIQMGEGEEHDTRTLAIIRKGETHATLVSLALGIATSVVSKSPIPIIAVLIMVGYMLYLYENAINKRLRTI